MKILIFDGSLGGANGNTNAALNVFKSSVAERAELSTVRLSEALPTREILNHADAFVFASGTYWDSWGSPMQRFFEEATELEGDPCFVGKPAALITTMHSVGGKEVLNGLHGVINTFGLFVPPFCAFTYSFANHLALKSAGTGQDTGMAADLWRPQDLEILAENLLTAMTLTAKSRNSWRTWPVDSEETEALWLDETVSKRD